MNSPLRSLDNIQPDITQHIMQIFKKIFKLDYKTLKIVRPFDKAFADAFLQLYSGAFCVFLRENTFSW